MIESLDVYQGDQVTTLVPKASVNRPLWMIKHQAFEGTRRNVPAIVNLLPQSMKINKEWQFYIRAINHAMTIQHVSAIFGYFKAFCNGTGFGDSSDPRKNFLLNQDLGLRIELPQFDKIRSCIRATHTGESSGDYVWFETMDGEDLPTLKPGKRHPRTVAEINIDDYLYNPRDHRWLFFAANNIGISGNVTAFDHGGFYPWFQDGKRQVTWLPLVGTFPVRLHKDLIEQVTEIPSPYWP